MERRDEEGGVVVEGVVVGNGEQEVLVDVLILQTPNFLTTFVDNGVLVWMVSDGGGTRWGSKEMWEEFSFQGDGKREVRKDRSGQSRRGNNGDENFNDGQRKFFNGDVGKWDALNDFFELTVDIGVLVFGS
jgi:hypothetical protein